MAGGAAAFRAVASRDGAAGVLAGDAVASGAAAGGAVVLTPVLHPVPSPALPALPPASPRATLPIRHLLAAARRIKPSVEDRRRLAGARLLACARV